MTSIEVSTVSSSKHSEGVSTSVVTTKGALCGRGDISIDSLQGPGEEDGGGGVVVKSSKHINKDLGLAVNITHFECGEMGKDSMRTGLDGV